MPSKPTATAASRNGQSIAQAREGDVKSPGVLLHPTGVYRPGEVISMFGLKSSSLRREIREKRLRVSKRCGRYYFTGEMLLDWLKGGEIKK
jgi:hypothetical protein